MNLFPLDDDVVLYETGFAGDILDRKSISKQLSDFVERIESPVVLALDDKWGSGKTFFLKRWVAAHTMENDGSAVTVYFDAFEHDYLSDPLVSIIAAVSDRIPNEQQATLKKWKEVAVKLAKPAFGIALSMATFGAKQSLSELGDVIAEAASGEARDAAQSLWDVERERKDAVSSFKELLKELTRDSSTPIVIVVDELDRCRPDYALSVLEVIKHFFAVPKVHFILGINGSALENSVKARYGAEIDSEKYLRKFISVSFSLPSAIDRESKVKVISKYASDLSSKMGLPENLSSRCIELLEYVSEGREVSLRDVGRIFSRIALAPKEVLEGKKMPGWLDTFFVLVVTSVVDPEFHKRFTSGSLSSAEIRALLNAPKEKTVEYIAEDTHNSAYDPKVSSWLVKIIYCGGSETLAEVDELPSWKESIEREFDRFGVSNSKSIPSRIQRDWIELFKI